MYTTYPSPYYYHYYQYPYYVQRPYCPECNPNVCRTCGRPHQTTTVTWSCNTSATSK